jgi:hypothetical protein
MDIRLALGTIVGSLILTFGCATDQSVKQLSQDFTVIQGKLTAPPILENGKDRLIIYLKIESPIEEKTEIIVALAENEQEGKVLANLAERLKNSNEVAFLYGYRINKTYKEYSEGIDFIIVAVGVYLPYAEKYVVVHTDYGEGMMHAIRDVSWGDFLKKVASGAVKKAL